MPDGGASRRAPAGPAGSLTGVNAAEHWQDHHGSDRGDHGARARLDFLGLVGYTSLSAFEQAALAQAMAPAVEQKLVLARIAARRFDHLGLLEGEVSGLGGELTTAMRPFAGAVDSFNQHTATTLWAEALAKLVVVGGLTADFATEVVPNLAEEPGRLDEVLRGALDDGDLAGAPLDMLTAVLDADPELTGRVALHARRLLGELFSQAQRVAAAHPELTGLLTGHGRGDGDDLAALSDLMARLAARHAKRMERLGLA